MSPLNHSSAICAPRRISRSNGCWVATKPNASSRSATLNVLSVGIFTVSLPGRNLDGICLVAVSNYSSSKTNGRCREEERNVLVCGLQVYERVHPTAQVPEYRSQVSYLSPANEGEGMKKIMVRCPRCQKYFLWEQLELPIDITKPNLATCPHCDTQTAVDALETAP